MPEFLLRQSTDQDSEQASRLHVLEKNLAWRDVLPVFEKEFSICASQPQLRTYFIASIDDKMIGYA
jgi:hypothetical protein